MPSTVVIVVAGYAITSGMIAAAVAIAVVASVVMNKAFAVDTGYNDPSGNSPSLGNRQQVPPATDNKLPLVYGSAYVGGIITDLSITSDNQKLYYVISLCEVTNNGADTITFGNIYFGGKKVIFSGSTATVAGLLDESTGITSDTAAPYIKIYLYSNGYNSPVNSTINAQTLMQSSGLTYTWDSTKLMSNTAFAILVLTYNPDAGITGLQQTKFQVINSRNSAGDCFYDYLTNTVYGAALPVAQVDTASLTALNTYSNANFTYTDYDGIVTTQPRFKFNGVIDVKRTIMNNLQDMSSCCDCLIKYNEITAKWGVIVQQPTYTVAMALNDSNMVSAMSISPIDLSGSYNVAEVKYPDNTVQDSFNSVTYDLAQIDPSLLYPNEPVNKQSLNLPLCNNDVQAQYLATRFLKSAREDLQVQVNIDFSGIQLEAGDIVTITSTNYGWVDKLFRVNKVIEEFADDGAVQAKLTMGEFNPTIYDDTNITQFDPSPNTGIPDPSFFGTLTAPYVVYSDEQANIPYIQVEAYTAPFGITQYVEIWYSAYSSPTSSQLIFAGTSEVNSSGLPYDTFTLIPVVTLTNIPAGNWYFFTRMINSISASQYSPASTVFTWRPRTYQYSQRYLSVAYANDAIGTGFSFNPRGKTYYGLFNQNNATPNPTASNYTWYLSPSAFNTSGALIYLLYTNRNDRRFSFSAGFAAYAGGSGAFVPTSRATYDPSIWAGLEDGVNVIDLDMRTGQVTQTGTTSVGTGELSVINNPDGTLRAQLQEYLDFGGPYTKTSSVALLTIDVYGRVVGFETPDDFNYTEQVFTATAGQTVFNVTRSSTYISGQCWVFRNGLILDPTEYTDTNGSTGIVTLGIGALAGDIITITSFRSQNSSTGVYASFTRNSATLTNQSIYTASGFTLNTGYELLFLNGTIVNAEDYDISGQDITFLSNTTGYLQIIQWTPNNLGVANGTPVNVDVFTIVGQTLYSFAYNINAFNLYGNGCLYKQGTDYTTATNTYTLANSPTTNTNLMVQQTFARTGAA